MKFSLFSENLLYRLSPTFKYRILFICLFAWLPLLLLTYVSGLKLSAFISDFDVHVRLLVSLALLLYAQMIANERFQVIVTQFMQCHIISDAERKKYQTLVTSTSKLSNSIIAEIILFIFVALIGPGISNQILPFDISNWYIAKNNNSTGLTLPGYWYTFVSLPIFQFILLRWFYRIIIWYRFLWKVSKLKLQLNSLHPDQTGGIGFLVNSLYGLELFLVANSCLLAGMILNAVLNTESTLWQFQNEMITWISILLMIPLIPMTFFMRQLTRTKRNGTLQYDVVANRYVSAFRKKWIESDSAHEKILGTSDIQSLADLNNSFNVSAHMRILPVSKNSIFLLFFFVVLPFLPLLLTVISLDRVFTQVIGILF